MSDDEPVFAWYHERERALRDEMEVLRALGDEERAMERENAARLVHRALVKEVIQSQRAEEKEFRQYG